MTSASPVLGSNQASFQVPNPPFKKLPTLPDGNCLIHAIFGLLYEGGVYCEEAPSQRIQIAQKFRQHSKKHPCEVLRSFILRSKVTQESIDLEWLTRSMERDKEFLGLEHAELIAKVYRLNMRVYHEETYEKVDLFYNNNQAPSPDGIISFDGVGHWSQCVCPKPFANTFSGGLRFSYSTLQKRFEKNQGSVQAQERENKREVSTSSFFQDGYQESDEPFQSFLQNSWKQIGRGAVVDAAAKVIIRSLSEPEETHPDITQYFDSTDLDDKTTRYRSPNYALAGELQVLIQKHALLHYQLLQLLRINNRKLMDKLKPDTREWDAYTQRGDYGNSFWDIPHCILTWGTMGGAAAFSQTAVDKFRSLLARELVIIYLKEDNARIHYFQGREISPVTIDAPSLAAYEEYKKVILNASKAEALYGWTVRRGEKAWEMFKHTVKNELSHVTISGGVSLIMANPVPVVSQGVSSGISAFKAFVDPYDDQTRLHEVMPYVSPAMSLMQGDVSGAVIGVSCDIYLREQLKDHPTTELGKSFFVSSCKGVLTGSVEGYANSMVSFALTEAGQRVAPEDHFDNSIPTRLFRAALTSKDATGLVASQLTRAVDRRFNPIYFDRSHLATQAPEVVDIVYQVDKSRGDYYINLVENGKFQKEVGIAPSKEKAQDICNQLNYVIQQVNTLNSYAFGLQEAYEKAGIPLNEIPGKLTFAIPYFEMTGDGTKTKVYLNGEKTFTGTGFKASMDALKTQVNTKIQEYEATLKQNFPEFQGTRIPVPKPTKVPKEHGFWYNFWRHPLETLDDYGIGVNVNVNVEVPLYAEPKKPSYTSPPATVDLETIEVGRKEPSVRAPSVPSAPSLNSQLGSFNGEWNWQSFQTYQNALIMNAIEEGIASRNLLQLPSPHPLDLRDPNGSIESAHKEIWGQGFFDRNIEVLKMKTYPAGDNSVSNIPLWLRGFANPDHLSYDPQERIEVNSQCLVAGAHSIGTLMGQFIDELRTLGSIDSFVSSDGKITLQFDRTVSEKIERFLNKHLPNYGHIEGFHFVQQTSDVMTSLTIDVFAMPFFARFLATGTHSLHGRSVMSTRQGLGLAAKSPRALSEQRVYRSGFVSEKTAVKLAESSVASIKKINPSLPIEQGGRSIGRFQYTEGAFKHFHQVVPKGVHKGRLVRPFMRSVQIIEEIMQARPPMLDPKGHSELLFWRVPGRFRGSDGHWEIVLNSKNNMICHFNFQ